MPLIDKCLLASTFPPRIDASHIQFMSVNLIMYHPNISIHAYQRLLYEEKWLKRGRYIQKSLMSIPLLVHNGTSQFLPYLNIGQSILPLMSSMREAMPNLFKLHTNLKAIATNTSDTGNYI